MNPGLDRRLWAAEDPADLWEAEVLFKTEDENRPVSPSKTSECSAHRLTLELTYSSGCGIKDGRIGASIPKRREEAPYLALDDAALGRNAAAFQQQIASFEAIGYRTIATGDGLALMQRP